MRILQVCIDPVHFEYIHAHFLLQNLQQPCEEIETEPSLVVCLKSTQPVDKRVSTRFLSLQALSQIVFAILTLSFLDNYALLFLENWGGIDDFLFLLLQ